MRLPRRVLRSDGLTLHPFHLAKAVAGFADDRKYIALKIALLVVCFLLASWGIAR